MRTLTAHPRRMLLHLFLAAALGPSSATLAQARPGARPLSLGQAMSLAAETANGARAARAAVRRADAGVRSARSTYWPQLSGSLTYQRTLETEYDDLFAIPDDPAPDMGMGLGDLPFARDHAWRATLSLSQDLWNFGRTASEVDAALAELALARESATMSTASARLLAARAYLDALLATRLLTIAEMTLAQTQATLDATELGFQQGARPEYDVLRARVNRDNQLSVTVQQRAEVELARVRLCQAVGLPLDTPLALTTRLEGDELAAEAARLAGRPDLPPSVLAPQHGEPGERSAIRLAQARLDASLAEADRAAADRYPRLVLSSNLGVVNYPPDTWPQTDTDLWYTNWTVTVGLAVPIFTGFATTARIDAARAAAEESRYHLAEAERAAVVDRLEATKALEVAWSTWTQNARTVGAAERAYDIAQLRFEQGVSSQLDLSDTRLSLAQSRINRAQAAHAFQLARIRLALLPALPLSDEAQAGAQTRGLPGASATGAGDRSANADPTTNQALPLAPGALPGAAQILPGTTARGFP